MKKLTLILVSVFFVQFCNAQTSTIDYFGQTPAGDSAVIFAPGIFSLSNRFENCLTFSPDGNEIYFGAGDGNNSGIYYTKRVNNKWTEQVKEPIFDGFENPVFSANGKKMYLTKYVNLGTDNLNSDIWISERTTEGWGLPKILPAPVNSSSREGSYSETADSILYIYSNRSGGFGEGDIWCVHPKADLAENLGSTVNTASFEGDAVIARDGSYIIFLSNRKGSKSSNDFYVSFNKGNNEWTAPLNMEISGAGINLTGSFQISPALSPDGKFLFFNRHKETATGWIMDIYWVSTHILDNLKKIAMPTTSVKEIIDQKIKLYPNPTTSLITVTLDRIPVHEAIVEIYNLQGNLLFNRTFRNKIQETIDLSGHTSGMYLVKVVSCGVSYKVKVLKE